LTTAKLRNLLLKIVLLEMLAKMLLKMMLSSRFFLEIVLQAVSSHHAIIQVHALTHKLSQCR
jgi:SNF family Na+-dependent transporter